MASFIGNISAFNENTETFVDYADRMQSFLTANSVQNDVKVHTFLALVGADAFTLLKNLCSPEKPSTKSYQELIKLLSDHYCPKPIEIAERDRFWNCKQGEHESVADFVVHLKRLAVHCNFGDFYQQALRDRLVSGLHPKMEKTHSLLLTFKNLTFERAKENCLADEMAHRASTDHMRDVRTTDRHATAHQVSEQPSKPKNSFKGYPKSKSSRKEENGRSKQSQKCIHCGRKNHVSNECRFKNAVCHACGNKGHIKPVCKSNPTARFAEETGCTMSSEVTQNPNVSDDVGLGMFNITSANTNRCEPYSVEMSLQGANVTFEIDTGSTRTLVNERVYQQYLSKCKLQNVNVNLKCYNGETIPLLGQTNVSVSYNGKVFNLPLLVVKGNKPSLLGRDWLNVIKLDWQNVFSVYNTAHCSDNSPKSSIDTLVGEFPKVFSSQSSGIKGFTAQVKVKANVSPVFQKARPVPYAIHSEIEKEYERLIDTDIVKCVEHSELGWASPAVHVPKANGNYRVCGDYKKVNECIEDDGYKLPNANDVFAKLPPNGAVFSVIDLVGAFNQLVLAEDSSKLLIMNTHKGFLAPKRLCYGIKTAPAIFQKTMDQILAGLENVSCYIDDILVVSESLEDHWSLLRRVFQRLDQYNVRVNKAKCKFTQSSVQYLGHVLSKAGVSPVEDKVQALRDAPRPTNVAELRSFVGMINFYGKFVPDLSTKLVPLYDLLQKGVDWNWSVKCEKAFQCAKDDLSSDAVLVHFDPKKSLVLSVDASPKGVGAVLSHKMPDGSEQPIACISNFEQK